MQNLILNWVICQKKEVYSVWWGWYLSKSWHAETKVGVGALLESRSESVVSSECVCLSDSHSVLRFSSMRTHTLVSSYTAPPSPSSSRRSHAMFLLPQPGHHGNLVYRCPSNSSNTALQNKKRENSPYRTNKLSYLCRKRKKALQSCF